MAPPIALFLIAACVTQLTSAVWIDETIKFQEGTDHEGQFLIDKMYRDGNTTEYSFQLKKLPLRFDLDRLNVAVVLSPVGTTNLKTQVFQMRVPPLGVNESNAVITQSSGIDYYDVVEDNPDFNYMTLREYARQLPLGQYNGYGLLEEGNLFEVTEQLIVNDPQDETKFQVDLKFVVEEQEPLGPNEVYLHWIFYKSTDIANTLTIQNVQGTNEPLVYYNLLTFSDYYSLDSIMIYYWIITAVSFIWLVGLPAQVLLNFILSGYMMFMDVKNFLNVFKWGNRSSEQSLRLAIWWWFLESFLLWDVGTYLLVNLMLILSMIPLIGPLCNIVITLIIYGLIYG